MFEPLDTVRLAYRHGKRRGWVVISSAMAPAVIGSTILLLENLAAWMAGDAAEPSIELTWFNFGMFVAAGCIVLYGAWLLPEYIVMRTWAC